MYALCFATILAVASAAPFSDFYHNHNGRHQDRRHHHEHEELDEFFGDRLFDTRKFWQELETELERFDTMLRDFYEHFPTTSNVGVKNNEYIITMMLNGFKEEDIKVKAKEGLVMVQATRRSEDDNQSYLDIKTLPSYVNVNGSWSFEGGVLKIVFPMKNQPDDDTVPVTETEAAETITTQAPSEEHSREDMDKTDNENTNEDADVGLGRGDKDKEHEISNSIPYKGNSVEATTYAVDLKNEVEFVPIRY